MDNSSLHARRNAAIARGVGVMTSLYAKKASNTMVYDVEGNEYIDFASGIATLNTGHCHPKVIAAAREQIDSFTHTCHQVIGYENYVRLAERLNELVPSTGDVNKTMFVTTGSEAVENAVKIARAATGRFGVIAFSGAFHGRTMLSMTLTGKIIPYKKGFGPLMPGVFHVPFPIELHGVTSADSIAAIEKLFKSDIEPEDVAAIIIEPVQGEGGFYVAPGELMTALRNICDRHGIVLIADEVQTGFARSGKMLAMEHYDVKADITTMAKSLGGGFPLSAVTGRADLIDAPETGALGGTYSGNPVAIAAANAVLDVIAEENLCQRASELGLKVKQRLEGMRANHRHIVDVRGLGFMIAMEFNNPTTNQPDASFANLVRTKALEAGLVLLTCGIYGNVIRLLAPVTVDDDLLNKALAIIEKAIEDSSKSS